MLTLEKLSALLAQNGGAASASVKEFSLAGEHFAFNSDPAIMGVINLSPDSWYRESVCLTVDRAVGRAHVLRAQGARIIDVGAESTLASATPWCACWPKRK
jgi:dihydropteroate synthase